VPRDGGGAFSICFASIYLFQKSFPSPVPGVPKGMLREGREGVNKTAHRIDGRFCIQL
jgi:hypothetical protein